MRRALIRRHEARRFFRAAPPYCIEIGADGTAMLCQKFYEYWPNQEPEEASKSAARSTSSGAATAPFTDFADKVTYQSVLDTYASWVPNAADRARIYETSRALYRF
jgi:hypothetical protein